MRLDSARQSPIGDLEAPYLQHAFIYPCVWADDSDTEAERYFYDANPDAGLWNNSLCITHPCPHPLLPAGQEVLQQPSCDGKFSQDSNLATASRLVWFSILLSHTLGPEYFGPRRQALRSTLPSIRGGGVTKSSKTDGVLKYSHPEDDRKYESRRETD